MEVVHKLGAQANLGCSCTLAAAGWALIQPSEGRVVPVAGGSSAGGGLGNLLSG